MAYQTDAAGQDILSILRRFTSPRMGAFDNTNAPSPTPPAPDSDAARAISDPARYGGPSQAATVAVDPAAAAPAPPVPTGRRVVGDPAATGSIPAQAAPTAPAGQPGAVAGVPDYLPDFVKNDPIYLPWFQQQQRRRKDAEFSQGASLFGGGLGDLLGLKGGGGPGGGAGVATPGSSEATGSTDLSLGQFADFDKRAKDAAALVRLNNTVTAIAQENPGMSRAALQAMVEADPKKYAELAFRLADPRSRAEAQKELYQTIQEGQKIIDPSLQSDANLIEIARTLNLPNPTAPQTLAMLRATSPQQLQEMMKGVLTSRATKESPTEWQGREIEVQQKSRETVRKSAEMLPRLSYLVDRIEEGMRSGSWSADMINSAYRELGTFLGKEQGQLSAEQYNAAVQDSVREVIKSYGANASDRDREAAEASFGKGLSPEGARAQLGLVAKTQVWAAINHNANIDDRIARGNFTEGNRAALEAQKVNLPAVSDDTLRTMNIVPANVATLRAAKGTPQEAETVRAFDKLYGLHIGEWILGGS